MSHHEFDFEICNSGMRPIAEALVKKLDDNSDWKRLMGSYYEEPKKV